MGGDSFAGLPRLPLPRRQWRPVSRHRVGPLRSVAEAAPHPVLSGIRSGAVAGLVIVALLSLPVLLVLGAKGPAPAAFEPEARVWAATSEPVARVAAGPPAPRAVVPVAAAVVEANPVRAGLPEPARPKARQDKPVLGVELIPVLDDESGTLSVEEPPAPTAKPVRPSRLPPAASAPKAP